MRYDEVKSFLGRLYPEGPWVLTAIPIEQRTTVTKTFIPGEDAHLTKWLGEHATTHNIYYSVNKPKDILNGKASRSDIDSVYYLHVDIDPRAGEDLIAEQQRILQTLLNPPTGVPLPTAVIFSGGGYNALWKLREPFPIAGEPAAYETAKRYNQQIEILFGADSCHNVDRILRLPGTTNYPNARKQLRGRIPIEASLVFWEDDRVYPLSLFTPAPLVQQLASGFSGNTVQVSGNIQRLTSVDELDKWSVPDKIKTLIVQGKDIFNPQRYPSRSEIVFAVCCGLVRANVDDDTIYAVLTDPDFKISESILDKGSNAESYAIRQIERAHENAINPWLRQLNEHHAVIGNLGGKCRIIEEIEDEDLSRKIIIAQTFDDFRNRYSHVDIEVGTNSKGETITTPLGRWWITHNRRRNYERLVFSPGRSIPNAYNLWQGFAIHAIPGDKHASFLDHIKNTICSGNQTYSDYLIKWMARAVQFPNQPGHVAVVLRGEKGVGKSFFAVEFGKLWGRHFLSVSNPKHLVGAFNYHLMDCVVLFGDEAFYAGDKQHEGILKTLITEDFRVSEAKGRDSEIIRNYIHLIMASNHNWVVPAGGNERRFFVLDVDSKFIQQTSHFAAIANDLNNRGRESLLHFLLTYPLDDYDVRNVPKTAALDEQRAFSYDLYEEWWADKLREGRTLPWHDGWCREIVTTELFYDFSTYARATNSRSRISPTQFGISLSKLLPGEYPLTVQRRAAVEVTLMTGERKVVQRPRWYLLPTLDECRSHWDQLQGTITSWIPTDPSNEEEISENIQRDLSL